MSNVSMPLLEIAKERKRAHGDGRANPLAVQDDRRPISLELSDVSFNGIAILCAEYGMGKTNALACAVASWQTQGCVARYVDFAAFDVNEAIHTMKELLRWCSRRMGNQAMTRVLVACDNVCAADEADSERMASYVRRMCAAGASVALAMLPEAELVVDALSEARPYWSCDLCVEDGACGADSELGLYTHGIPALVGACRKVKGLLPEQVPTHPSYVEAYAALVGKSLRRSIMGEERRTRCAMLLLGCGTKEELGSVVDGLDDVVWRLLARDAPLFGVDVLHGRFACVGCQTVDCLSVSYAEVNEEAREWPGLVARATRVLATRGEYGRAAFVSTMCSDASMRCAEVLRCGPGLIDAGEVDIVADALADARDGMLTDTNGFADSACTFAAVVEGAVTGLSEHWQVDPSTMWGRQATLWVTCGQRMRGIGLAEELDGNADSDTVSCALVAHANFLSLLSQGRLMEAYDELLDRPERLDGSTLTSAVVGIDFWLCSLLMGIVPSPIDVDAMERATRTLGRGGLRRYARLLEAARSAGRLLGGRLVPDDTFDAHIQWADREGATFLRGLLLVAAAVSDVRMGVLTRAHVRMQRAIQTFDDLDTPAMAKIARLLDVAIRSQLGGRVPVSDLRACEGVSRSLDSVVGAVCMCLSRSKRTRPIASGRGARHAFPRDLHWLINVLCNDCGSLSKRFCDEIPEAWAAESMRVTSEVDSFFDHQPSMVAAVRQGPDARTEGPGTSAPDALMPGEMRLRVSMLGGFEVRCGGEIVTAGTLERRRARPLLALLVAMPRHAVKRFVVMESIWPTKDYATANKCLYSATSALRSELGRLIGYDGDKPIVSANKVDGTVTLNDAVVTCDVDEFESKAREVLDISGDDRRIVELCREIEEVYRGDLFVPPLDGMGVVEARSRELAALFADAMVAGAGAGLRLGMKTLSCRLARKAHNADPLREDAVRVLVQALCSAGRRVEAERSYERYVGHMVDITDEPPSHELRKAVEDLLWGNPRRGSRRPVAMGDAAAARVIQTPAGASEGELG